MKQFYQEIKLLPLNKKINKRFVVPRIDRILNLLLKKLKKTIVYMKVKCFLINLSKLNFMTNRLNVMNKLVLFVLPKNPQSEEDNFL